MIVRPAVAADIPAWSAMRRRLWPDEDPSELGRELLQMSADALNLVAEADGRLIGFAEAGIRDYAEGAPSGRSPYLEAIWVEPDRRRRGVARALVGAVEEWARGRGFVHLGSDALLGNAAGLAWHRAANFAEIERLVVFGKPLK